MKVTKNYNKKERKEQLQARFQLNKKEFYPKADTRKKLLDMVDEIRAQEHRTKYELPVMKTSPTLKELFDKHAPKIPEAHQKTLFERVAETLLSLLPNNLKVNPFLILINAEFLIGYKKATIPAASIISILD